MWRTTLVAGALLLGTAGLGGAGHGCNGLVTELPGGIYVDDRDFMTGGLWVYQESNGVPGLQSGGVGAAHPVGQTRVPVVAPDGLFSSLDPCDHADPDLLLF